MRDAKKGTYNGDFTYCTVNAYGDCPYCDQCGICHIDNPVEDCDDTPEYEDDDCDYEVGYNPYEGAYDYDC